MKTNISVYHDEVFIQGLNLS